MKTRSLSQSPKFRWATNRSPNFPEILRKRDASIELMGTYPPRCSWSAKTDDTPSGSAASECGTAAQVKPNPVSERVKQANARTAAGNAFLRCMAEVMAATLCSMGCLASASYGYYLPAVLVGFLASILWRSALWEGREAARLSAQCQDDE